VIIRRLVLTNGGKMEQGVMGIEISIPGMRKSYHILKRHTSIENRNKTYYICIMNGSIK
jgi:hypothetical protein